MVEPEQNPIGALFYQWHTFKLNLGCIIYAFSSSFNLMPKAKDGNAALFTTLDPMSSDNFKSLVELLISKGLLPDLCLTNFNDFFKLCGGLPREAEMFGLFWNNHKQYDWGTLKNSHIDERVLFYTDRIGRLLKKKDIGENLLKESIIFASRIFMGEKIEYPPPLWRNAGMVMRKDDGCYGLTCPPAERALICAFDEEVMRDAIALFHSDPSIRWRALELAFVYVFRKSIISGNQVPLYYYTDLRGRDEKTIYVKVKDIQHSTSFPLPNTLPPGTLFVCPRNQAIIDFFIHDSNGLKILVQVSESAYIDHRSKYTHEGVATALTPYEKAVKDGNNSAMKYVYLTTSYKLMKFNKDRIPMSEHFNKDVMLVAKGYFFNNLI